MIRAVSFFDCTRLEASWASHGEDGWCHGSSYLLASSVGELQIINFCAQGPPNILRYRHHFLYCLLLSLLRWIPWSSCTEHVPKFYSMESLMKLPFQWVVIDPKRTPDEELMVILLRHYALSRDISERVALKDFTITLHTDLQNSRFLMRWKEDLMEIYNIQFYLMVLLWSWTKISSQQQHFGDDDDPIARFSSRACFIPIAWTNNSSQKHQSLKSIDTAAYLIYHLLLWGVGTR